MTIVFSKDDECYTPKYIIDYFGNFDYDPATTIEKAKEFEISNFDTKETDGLRQDWTKYKRIWINPPFTLKWEFLNKAIETYQKAKNEIYILLPIMALTTIKFSQATKNVGGILFLPNKRINFESGLNRKFNSASFGSVILKLNSEKDIVIKRIVI